MTYQPNIPQPTDIPAISQSGFLTDFQRLNNIFSIDHVQLGNVIRIASNENPCKITSASHGLSNGNSVTVYNMRGTTPNPNEEIVSWGLSGPYVISNVTTDTFTIPVDTTDTAVYPTYLSGSGDFTSISYNYGYHTKLSLPQVLQDDPDLVSPFSSLYPKIKQKITQLFFQNTNSGSDQLTKLKITQKSDQTGFITPWGLIINFGEAKASQSGANTTLAVPFSNANYTVISSVINLDRLTPLVSISVEATSGSQIKVFTGVPGKIKINYIAFGV